jgi:hypothetical protein
MLVPTGFMLNALELFHRHRISCLLLASFVAYVVKIMVDEGLSFCRVFGCYKISRNLASINWILRVIFNENLLVLSCSVDFLRLWWLFLPHRTSLHFYCSFQSALFILRFSITLFHFINVHTPSKTIVLVPGHVWHFLLP